MKDLSIMLQECPILYRLPDKNPNELTSKASIDEYEIAVGVTLDLVPEENKWIASYADFYEGEARDTPEEAVESLMGILKNKGLM